MISSLQVSATRNNGNMKINHLGDNQTIIKMEKAHKYMLLPIQESSQEARLNIIVDNNLVNSFNVRLAVDSIDYYVPLELPGNAVVNIHHISDGAVCWDNISLSESFDTSNREKYRPVYHFTPAYGWMNDPNGMVYKDGEYHLFYQHNPYGSMWGNMHWGHAVSKDLVNWSHMPEAIAPDWLGAVFSGSCVVDKNNTAGFGKDAIIAIYTSASEKQSQSIAYSTDNGRTFKRYNMNPVLTSQLRDFRDPKVFWYEPANKWILILAAGQEMQIYSSSDLKEWTLESSFGEGQGAHGGVWECPDLIQLPVEGTDKKKWVLIGNLNPGGPFGGSATQYFVGDFDGHRFTNEFPAETKWMDYGKDHYATVTWSNIPDNRHVAIAWMSNWQYANDVPTKQYRSANSIPRDLTLYETGNNIFIKNAPVKELLNLRSKAVLDKSFGVNGKKTFKNFITSGSKSYEIELDIKNKNAKIIGISFTNSKGEDVTLEYNVADKKLSADRTRSGITGFSKDFPAVTSAPVESGSDLKLRIFVDSSSMEVFVNGGKSVMTNLMFPKMPYDNLVFYSNGGSYEVTSLKAYQLKDNK